MPYVIPDTQEVSVKTDPVCALQVTRNSHSVTQISKVV